MGYYAHLRCTTISLSLSLSNLFLLYFILLSLRTEYAVSRLKQSVLTFWHHVFLNDLDPYCLFSIKFTMQLPLGQFFCPSFLCLTFIDDIFDVGRDDRGLIVALVSEGNHACVAWFKKKTGTAYPEEGKGQRYFCNNGKCQMLSHPGLDHIPCSIP